MNNQKLKNDNSNANNGQNSYIERSCLLFYLERKKKGLLFNDSINQDDTYIVTHTTY